MTSPDPARTSSTPTEGLTGVLERIVFFNEENHYCIAEFRPDGADEKVTILGNLPGVQCGETLAVQGRWQRHPRHGDQFRVDSFNSRLPATVYGIRKYLGSGLVPGIGRGYAKKIVDHFGLDTFKVISQESARLKEIPGIGAERARSIKAAWDDQCTLRDVLVFLQTYGVGVAQCSRLVKRYGHEAGTILRTDPYRAAREIPGIGFRTADKIAINLGLGNDSPARLDAGLVYMLEQLQDEGHTSCPADALIDRTAELLQSGPDLLRDRLAALVGRRDLLPHPESLDPAADPARFFREASLQLPVFARAEAQIARAVHRLLAAPSGLPPIKTDAAVAWAQDRAGFTFDDRQREAVREALRHKILLLTGGPGTGKTTILRALSEILRAKKVRLHLASPTGRAAQRLAEATGGHAQTLHRLLRFDPAEGGFSHDESRPLKTEFLVIDEASMLDARLSAAVFRALPSSAHLLLVGDTDQLPSVGAGQVLHDLSASGLVRSIRLDTIYRQRQDSLIVTTAHEINRGRTAPPSVVSEPSEAAFTPDLVFFDRSDPAAAVDLVVRLCREILPQRFGFDPVRDIQVLAPMHRGPAGVEILNRRLQEALNPSPDPPGPAGFRPGDKVLQTRNNYEKGVFNGDIGLVRPRRGDAPTFEIDFEGEVHLYDRSDLADLTLAYAISIHKSQGSEYPAVVIPLLKGHFMMLQRNLLYTAITRGKKRVILVGDPAAFAMAVRNADSRTRATRLRERLLTPPSPPGH
ncbi:MAG: ATP-dependent RecD-like DNA helicase [Puniceicoccaceae bacterium]|nr:MAG: ATP-dependent RecD-like DNA helicase [Puniceicoccaceae bacterium]